MIDPFRNYDAWKLKSPDDEAEERERIRERDERRAERERDEPNAD